ncbi:hypothetical protein NKDENANG_03573 [Candidatus Entotheonellaceae bacterium PAL068K]
MIMSERDTVWPQWYSAVSITVMTPTADRRADLYALENLSPASNLPDEGQWVHGAELHSVRIAIPEHREIIGRWLQEVARETVPTWRAPLGP